MATTGFFAYPESSQSITDAILGAVEIASSDKLEIKPWQRMNIIGFKLDDLIREHIHEASFLAADITYPNPNVLYELGYAISIGKPIVPTLNTTIDGAVARVQKIGLFDTIGWATYANAEELAAQLNQWPETSWTGKYTREKNHGRPLFILDTVAKTDFRNHIFHAVENSHVKYRSFDPTQVPRLTAAQAVAEVSSSAGVIIPILQRDIVDSLVHNLRAAFILGLAHGYDIDPLAIQYGHGPLALDYRDFVTNSTFRKETENHVEQYCAETLVWNQSEASRARKPDLGLLSQINLGSPTAENEAGQLPHYFVKTAEYSRALRAEGGVVIGRKGSGKSAIFLQVAESNLRSRNICVVDLRPASHNLSEMRETLLGVATAGVFDHTIASFWQYIMYIEIILKIREVVLPKARNDFSLQERVRELEEKFSLTESMVSGDFTSRLELAVRNVIEVLSGIENSGDIRSKLTNIMFERTISQLRDSIASFHDMFDDIVVLIDDLDKGWPPRQVEAHDVRTIRHLIEVLNRIQRDLVKKRMGFRHLIFLRSDIYEKLVEDTSDRGKYNVIKVDWSDPEQLRHLLKQRVLNGISPELHEDAWGAVNPVVDDTDAVSLMIETSLRRPRFLIDLCERVLSFAINRGHGFVVNADVDEGMRQMSLYLVSDFGYEMRDIAGTPEDVFYLFIGSSDLLTEEQLQQILSDDRLGLGVEESIDLLLWYGFLGVVSGAGDSIFIYDTAYDFRRLEAERNPVPCERLYAVNPAFLRGLARTERVEIHH